MSSNLANFRQGLANVGQNVQQFSDAARAAAAANAQAFQAGIAKRQSGDVRGFVVAVVLVIVILSLIVYMSSKRRLLCIEDTDPKTCENNYLWNGVLSGLFMGCVLLIVFYMIRKTIQMGQQ